MSRHLGRVSLYAAIFAVFTVILFSWNHFQSAKDQVDNAMENLTECRRLTSELDRFRDAPRVASLEIEPPDRIAARVTSAAANAMLSPTAIYSVDPQSPARVARSAYQIRATQIVLQDASLSQIANFVSGLEDSESGMIVRDIALTASSPTSESNREPWNARLTLTQMIFSPQSNGEK